VRPIRRALTNVAVAGLLASIAIATATATGPYTVIAGGLISPRGLTWGPGGRQRGGNIRDVADVGSFNHQWTVDAKASR
jgi:hypothetical protein